VTAIGVVAVAVVGTAAVGVVGHATAARVGLEGAADAAALAGADTVAGFVSGDPCLIAARVADLNDARLASCSVSGSDVEVVAGTTVLGDSITARAKAGPPPLAALP
jgi:secretion/DNA translocation related TadE-like protein